MSGQPAAVTLFRSNRNWYEPRGPGAFASWSSNPPEPRLLAARQLSPFGALRPFRLGQPERPLLRIGFTSWSGTRRRIAVDLAARPTGGGTDIERAKGLLCVGCGRPDLYFFIDPKKMTRAHCAHRNSCGHTVQLWELL